MDINYKTILEYLSMEVPEDVNNNNFPTKKNIMVSSDNFPEVFSNLLVLPGKKTFYRYGVTRYNNEQNNISFLSSFLTLLNKEYITLDKSEELSEIKSFMTNIRSKILEKGFKFELKNRFEHQILLDRIEKLTFDDGLLGQLISQVLDVNFIIFDFKTEKIETMFKGDFLNPWKVTFLLGKYENYWEPIMCDKKQFSYNDSFLKKILTNEEIHYYNEEYLSKCYSLLDNTTEIANFENLSEVSDNEVVDNNLDDNSEDESSESDTFINPVNEIKNMKLNKTKLRSLKKDEIFELLSRLNVNITKDTNKNEMIKSLLPYI